MHFLPYWMLSSSVRTWALWVFTRLSRSPSLRVFGSVVGQSSCYLASLRSKRFRAVSRVKDRETKTAQKMARVGGKGVGKKGRKCSPSPLFPFFGSRFISRAAKTENLVLGHSLLRNSTETLVTVTQATISLVHLPTSRYQFYQEREARAVDFLCFLR